MTARPGNGRAVMPTPVAWRGNAGIGPQQKTMRFWGLRLSWWQPTGRTQSTRRSRRVQVRNARGPEQLAVTAPPAGALRLRDGWAWFRSWPIRIGAGVADVGVIRVRIVLAVAPRRR